MLCNGNAKGSLREIMIKSCTKKHIWVHSVEVLVQVMIYSCINKT